MVDEEHWISNQEEGVKLGGIVPDSLRYAFDKPIMDPKADHGMDFRDYDLDEHEARVHMDCAITRIMTSAGWTVALATTQDDTVRSEIIAASMEKDPMVHVFDGEKWHDPDPSKIDARFGLVNVLGGMLGEKLAAQREAQHAKELAERDRRRAARAAGDVQPESYEDITQRLSGYLGNRAERRRAEREARKKK